ncbi:restriction endonuclease subunit S [Pectobacterium punjabense]|uniref:restriction endonuclease subunit S n=1 Tax=Pectobacterium punjabense TaxID=2108399 RepID=UPI003D9ACCEE
MAGLNKYKAYPEYNCTNTEGLVQLPALWKLKQVRYILKDGFEGTKIGPFGSALRLEDMVDDGVQVYGQENVIKRDFSIGKRRISFNKFKEMRVYEVFYGDILITMMGTSGKCEIVPHDAEKGIIDSHLIRVRVNNDLIIPDFFKLLVDESPEIKHQISIQGKGSIMLGLNSGIIKSLYLPLPSIAEQRTILIFLDYEVTKIDSLIEKQQQLIELLKEKRQAVISHAVTKGLNPNVPMKDSGVEWLGEVPEHWNVQKFKYLCTSIIAGPFGSSITKDMYIKNGYKVYGQEQVIPNDFNVGDYYISDGDFKKLARYSVKPGDVLISCVGTFGKIAIFPEAAERGIINPRLIKATLDTEFNPYFVRELLKSDTIFKQFELLSRGGTMGVINIAILNEILTSIPPCNEQEHIFNFVKEQKIMFKELIEKALNQIILLQERRTALISAAVTGKIDVRDWVAPANSEMADIEVSPEVNA